MTHRQFMVASLLRYDNQLIVCVWSSRAAGLLCVAWETNSNNVANSITACGGLETVTLRGLSNAIAVVKSVWYCLGFTLIEAATWHYVIIKPRYWHHREIKACTHAYDHFIWDDWTGYGLRQELVRQRNWLGYAITTNCHGQNQSYIGAIQLRCITLWVERY